MSCEKTFAYLLSPIATSANNLVRVNMRVLLWMEPASIVTRFEANSRIKSRGNCRAQLSMGGSPAPDYPVRTVTGVGAA